MLPIPISHSRCVHPLNALMLLSPCMLKTQNARSPTDMRIISPKRRLQRRYHCPKTRQLDRRACAEEMVPAPYQGPQVPREPPLEARTSQRPILSAVQKG